MDQITAIGVFAALFTTAAFVPQVVAIIRTGNVDGISLSMYSIFTVGVALWLGYGILMQDLPMLLANSVTLLLAISVLILTIKTRLKQKKLSVTTEQITHA